MTALVLAGGKARRMDHTEKALLTFRGISFLEHILDQLKEFDQVLLSADKLERYSAYTNLEVVTDLYPETGPIGGLYTGLCCSRNDCVLVLPCDTPLITADFCKWLCTQLVDEVDVVIPQTDDGIHPIPAVWRTSCAPLLREQLEAGEYGIRRVLSRLKVALVRPEDGGFCSDVLTNINTLEQYVALI